MNKKHEVKPVEKPAKPDVKPKPNGKVVNPSEKLANLLRREGMIAAKVKKAQEELKAVQADILNLWEARQEQAKQLLSENPEG